LEWGLAAPLEVAFVTLDGLARMPARPGTVELARSGRVLFGDAAVMERLPLWEPASIDREERMLLLENRAFELWWAVRPAAPQAPVSAAGRAGPVSPTDDPVAVLLARHA